MLFINQGKLVEVLQNSGCISYGGIGVVFGAEYLKNISAKKQREKIELKEPLLPDANLNQTFKKLVGADYKDFFDTFQMIYEDQEKDLDGFNASILSGGVTGLFSLREGIIMYDKSGKIWAAILNPGQEAVYYYTNDPNYLAKLPKTIQNWQNEKQPQWKIVFKSREINHRGYAVEK